MPDFVIGISSHLNHTEATAMDIDGKHLATVDGPSICFLTVSRSLVHQRFEQLIQRLMDAFHGETASCRCLLVSASGIDSPRSHQIFMQTCQSPRLCCPVYCLNDGTAALYGTTKGEGILTIADMGTICVGRRRDGTMTRSGGYPITVLGNEGSAQWIALSALHLAFQWLDGNVEETLLIEKLNQYFGNMEIEKLLESANVLRRKNIDIGIALLVMQCADAGDKAAIQILKTGARDLFAVAKTVVQKLKMEEVPFLCGLYGSVFQESSVYRKEYCRLFRAAYPACRFVELDEPEAENAARMALDYLNGKIPYIEALQANQMPLSLRKADKN